MGRARGRHHDIERLQRDVAIDRQRRLQSERTDAADFVPGDLGDFLEAEHLRLSSEQRLHLLVVHPRGAGRHDQHHALADPQAQRFCDPRRLDAVGFGGQRDGGGAHAGFDHGDIGRLFCEESADGLETHFRTLWQTPGREVRRGRGCDDRARRRVHPSGYATPKTSSMAAASRFRGRPAPSLPVSPARSRRR